MLCGSIGADDPPAPPPILRAAGIVREYHLGRVTLRVLRGVDVTVETGQFAAIVGASGSGKSTLLHILGALDIPQQGQVWFRGRPIFEPESQRVIPDAARRGRADAAAFDEADRAAAGANAAKTAAFLEPFRNDLRNRRVGFVFQFYHLLPEFDVLENVMMPALVGRSVPAWSADAADVRGRAEQLLDGVQMSHRLRHRPGELSGGERQRVAIARALMNGPDVLLADEPTGNLDTQTGADIMERLRALNSAGQTIVIVTHDAEIAARADVTIRLVDGMAV